MKVLVVDDEKIKRITLRDDLREENYDTIAVESPAVALQLFQNEHFDVLVTDLRMPKMHGIEFLKRVKKDHPHVTVIIMTAYASVETAVEAMKWGAYNYIKKPFSSDELISMLDKLKEIREGVDKGGSETQPQTAHFEPWRLYHNVIGKSRSLQDILSLIETIADSSGNILISGESGTGRNLWQNPSISIVHADITPIYLSTARDYRTRCWMLKCSVVRVLQRTTGLEDLSWRIRGRSSLMM